MSNGGKATARYISVLALGLHLTPAACSGRVDVGSEAAGGSSYGATAGSRDEATGGSGEATGGSSGAAAGAGNTGNTGNAPASGGTSSMPIPSDACGYGPTTLGPDPRPLLSSEEVLARLGTFLEDDAGFFGELAVPATPSAAWAAHLAEDVLDAHASADTPAPGLTRFLTRWLDLAPENDELQAPPRWSSALVEPDATLSTLLTAEGGDPNRVGILTEREFLTAHATISERGSWMSGNLLCVRIPPPPPSVDHAFSDGVGATRRQRYESLATHTPVCAGCHNLMDPAGYSLEHYDEVGDFRTHEGMYPIDASGNWSAAQVSFDEYADLAPQLASSCQVAHCFSSLLARDAFGLALQSTTGTDAPLTELELKRVARNFVESGFSIRVLVENIVRSPSFLR